MQEELSEKILRLIRHELYIELRYMESALSVLGFRRTDGLFTFATDGVFLYFSEEPLLRLFQSNPKFLDRAYLHTILHCVFSHLWLCGGRDRRLWFIACDIAVESVIDSLETGVTKRILSWLRKDTYAKITKESGVFSAAVIYRWLKAAGQETTDALAKEFYTDDHRFWPKEEDMEKQLFVQARKNWDQAGRQVMLESSRRGEDGQLDKERLAAQICAGKNKRSYREFLRRFAIWREEPHLNDGEFDLGYYTYGFSLYGNLPLIEPLETREAHKIKELVIVLDTSDSTSGELAEGFLRETYAILLEKSSFFDSFVIHILQCDNRVQKEDVIHNKQELERLLLDFRLFGGGGTDFRPAFSYVEKLREEGELKNLLGLLYFTDGKGTYPKKKPDYKTAFLFLEDYDETAAPPWAMRLRLDAEEFLDEYQTGKGRN